MYPVPLAGLKILLPRKQNKTKQTITTTNNKVFPGSGNYNYFEHLAPADKQEENDSSWLVYLAQRNCGYCYLMEAKTHIYGIQDTLWHFLVILCPLGVENEHSQQLLSHKGKQLYTTVTKDLR